MFTVRIIFKLLVVFGLLEFQCYVHKLVLGKEHLFRLLKHLFANPMLCCDVRKPTSARQVILSSPMMDDIFAWFLGPHIPLWSVNTLQHEAQYSNNGAFTRFVYLINSLSEYINIA